MNGGKGLWESPVSPSRMKFITQNIKQWFCCKKKKKASRLPVKRLEAEMLEERGKQKMLPPGPLFLEHSPMRFPRQLGIPTAFQGDPQAEDNFCDNRNTSAFCCVGISTDGCEGSEGGRNRRGLALNSASCHSDCRHLEPEWRKGEPQNPGENVLGGVVKIPYTEWGRWTFFDSVDTHLFHFWVTKWNVCC